MLLLALALCKSCDDNLHWEGCNCLVETARSSFYSCVGSIQVHRSLLQLGLVLSCHQVLQQSLVSGQSDPYENSDAAGAHCKDLSIGVGGS